jgi:hypothetical protein
MVITVSRVQLLYTTWVWFEVLRVVPKLLTVGMTVAPSLGCSLLV